MVTAAELLASAAFREDWSQRALTSFACGVPDYADPLCGRAPHTGPAQPNASAVRLPDGNAVSVCREVRSRAREVACLIFSTLLPPTRPVHSTTEDKNRSSWDQGP